MYVYVYVYTHTSGYPRGLHFSHIDQKMYAPLHHAQEAVELYRAIYRTQQMVRYLPAPEIDLLKKMINTMEEIQKIDYVNDFVTNR